MWPDRDGGDAGRGATAGVAPGSAADSDPAEGGGRDPNGAGGVGAPVPDPRPQVTGSGAGPSAGERVAAPGEFALLSPSAPLQVQVRMKKPPAAGVLFAVDSGEVLWQRHPRAPHPMASL